MTFETFSTGQVLTATATNDTLTKNKGRPLCAVWRSTNQSIANSTNTAISWNSEDIDTDVMHDNATNPTRITIKTAGYYLVSTAITWGGAASGDRSVWFAVNGGANQYFRFRDNAPTASANAHNNTQGIIPLLLAVNDYIEVIVLQSSGASLNIIAGQDTTNCQVTFLSMS